MTDWKIQRLGNFLEYALGTFWNMQITERYQ